MSSFLGIDSLLGMVSLEESEMLLQNHAALYSNFLYFVITLGSTISVSLGSFYDTNFSFADN